MASLKKAWKLFERAALFVGDVISGVVLTVFYYTVFALFAIPFRMFAKNPLGVYAEDSNWIPKVKTPEAIEDFKNE